MKKIPFFAAVLVIVAMLATTAATHPITTGNGVVRDYSPGKSITLNNNGHMVTYLLRSSTVMLGFGGTSGIAVTGGTGTSSAASAASTAIPSTSGTATAMPGTGTIGTATAMPSTGTSATATPGSGSTGTAGTAGTTTNVNGLGLGARVTVVAECFGDFSAGRHSNANDDGSKTCFALAVIVRSPAGNVVPATGGNPATTSTPAATSSPVAPSGTGTPAVTPTATP